MHLSRLTSIYQCKCVSNEIIRQSRYYCIKNSQWNTVVGLEIHAQISSNSKLFSGAKCDFNALVNNCVSILDASIPGTLPVLNKRCVEAGVLAASALSCKINPVSMFDRKHYFYADLPAGYQITQQRLPLAQEGQLSFQVYIQGQKPYAKISKIKQIQLEQDSGKSLHDDESNLSLVDLNRAGLPLMELVFEPDLKDGEEAAALVKELILILTRLGCCNGRMEEGAVRVDANVSVNRPNESLGTRTEIKNIGSVRGVAKAITYEVSRQIKILNSNGVIQNETRSWDPVSKTTVAMRDKEIKQDYRYMPEPNLPPLHLNMSDRVHPELVNVREIQKQIPELPEESRQRLMTDYEISLESSIRLVNEDILYSHFKEIIKNTARNPKTVVNTLLNEFLTSLNRNGVLIENCTLTSDAIGRIIDMRQNGEINSAIIVKLFDLLASGSQKTPEEIVDEKNWRQITKDADIDLFCRKIMDDNPNMVKQYKSGKTQVIKALMKIVNKNSDERITLPSAKRRLTELLKD